MLRKFFLLIPFFIDRLQQFKRCNNVIIFLFLMNGTVVIIFQENGEKKQIQTTEQNVIIFNDKNNI